jgi:hypothetical protein
MTPEPGYGSHAALDEASRRLMMEIGPVWGQDIQKHRDIVLGAYGPVLEDAPNAGVKVLRDIAYGPHAGRSSIVS